MDFRVRFGDLGRLHGVGDLHVAQAGVVAMAHVHRTAVAVRLPVRRRPTLLRRERVVRPGQRYMVVAVYLLIVNIVPIVAVSLQRQSRAANVTLEAALVEVSAVLQRSHLVGGVHRLATSMALLFHHRLKRPLRFTPIKAADNDDDAS